MRTPLACFALALSGSLALAAPAPFAREVADAKVNLQRQSLEKVTRTVLSDQFVSEVLKDKRVLALACLKGNSNSEEWLRSRLKVKPAGNSSARICLEKCPPKDALVVLSAVLETYVGKVDPSLLRLRQQLDVMRQQEARIMEIVKRGAMARANIDLLLERYKARVADARAQVEKVEATWIAQKPKLVRSGH